MSYEWIYLPIILHFTQRITQVLTSLKWSIKSYWNILNTKDRVFASFLKFHIFQFANILFLFSNSFSENTFCHFSRIFWCNISKSLIPAAKRMETSASSAAGATSRLTISLPQASPLALEMMNETHHGINIGVGGDIDDGSNTAPIFIGPSDSQRPRHFSFGEFLKGKK